MCKKPLKLSTEHTPTLLIAQIVSVSTLKCPASEGAVS